MNPDELKALRKRKRWKQADLARELDVSIHTVQSWEQGRNPIPPHVPKLLYAQFDTWIPLSLLFQLSEYAESRRQPVGDAVLHLLRRGLAASAEGSADAEDATTATLGEPAADAIPFSARDDRRIAEDPVTYKAPGGTGGGVNPSDAARVARKVLGKPSSGGSDSSGASGTPHTDS